MEVILDAIPNHEVAHLRQDHDDYPSLHLKCYAMDVEEVRRLLEAEESNTLESRTLLTGKVLLINTIVIKFHFCCQ